MADLFGLVLSMRTIANLEQATVQALATPVAEVRSYVQVQPAAYLDETGWWEGYARAWLWTAVTAYVTVAQELLRVVGHGSLGAYTWYPAWRR